MEGKVCNDEVCCSVSLLEPVLDHRLFEGKPETEADHLRKNKSHVGFSVMIGVRDLSILQEKTAQPVLTMCSAANLKYSLALPSSCTQDVVLRVLRPLQYLLQLAYLFAIRLTVAPFFRVNECRPPTRTSSCVLFVQVNCCPVSAFTSFPSVFFLSHCRRTRTTEIEPHG